MKRWRTTQWVVVVNTRIGGQQVTFSDSSKRRSDLRILRLRRWTKVLYRIKVRRR